MVRLSGFELSFLLDIPPFSCEDLGFRGARMSDCRPRPASRRKVHVGKPTWSLWASLALEESVDDLDTRFGACARHGDWRRFVDWCSRVEAIWGRIATLFSTFF